MNCHSYIYDDCTAWTGLNDLDIEGTYVWDHSNAPLNFSNWKDGEPSLRNPNHALTKDCIDILRGGVWNDRPCSYLNWVICEKKFWHWYTNNSDIFILLLLKSKHTELYCFSNNHGLMTCILLIFVTILQWICELFQISIERLSHYFLCNSLQNTVN